MINIHNVSLSYADRTVLRDVSLSLTERRIAVIGANGSGKSSFARMLNGLVLPTEGEVEIDGLNTRTKGKDIRQKVGFVFQNPDNQIVFPVVEEDLAFGMKNLGFSKEKIAQKTDEILTRYDMRDLREHPAHLLSGGQKQLLAISGVLVMEPSYIIMDEPTTLLDLRNKRRVSEAIMALEQTVILISHDLDLLHDFDRVIVFDEGRVVEDNIPSVAVPAYVKRMT
ncbi:ATP-binding cassette domain-containing protein [Shimia thalassica]|uniref:energy-coupling factor ABC transporter ATP-binding protein n=1 Tax=Shimia thalassica TaxID=1715693 RepID=UPI001C091192|nr:ATP-binding cassette domain-containing protein [Shimia thalassica]MBU2942838.1 ATP-binding cassette domain-containing protein [Shimia thalassica]MDO6502394.1 ATP-binding cassette domain-containing protein [Shimia thalassica]